MIYFLSLKQYQFQNIYTFFEKTQEKVIFSTVLVRNKINIFKKKY